ncbi:hypothetical protein [Oenococcus oeni]|uniref:hypothetical protein n=1 Tax=Oenococcus oeni TaxID=1247 RepID=UPI0015D6710D|nr:hypothetical protein [Oenococcus oeni]
MVPVVFVLFVFVFVLVLVFVLVSAALEEVLELETEEVLVELAADEDVEESGSFELVGED